MASTSMRLALHAQACLFVYVGRGTESQRTLYCRSGDPAQYIQEGVFKCVSQDGDVFGEYTLTVMRNEGDPTPLSPTYWFRMNSHLAGGQQSNIIFKRNS